MVGEETYDHSGHETVNFSLAAELGLDCTALNEKCHFFSNPEEIYSV